MRGERGITLVALVVTIIVLLILAGITITYVLADDGIFGKAELASLETIKGEIRDHVSIALLNAKTEAIIASAGQQTFDATALNSKVKAALPENKGQFGTITCTLALDEDGVPSGNIVINYGADNVYTVAVTDYTEFTVTRTTPAE
mgnify:CR=1 FL=1